MSPERPPSYLSLGAAELRSRARGLEERLSSCEICPRRCGADRIGGERGSCKIAKEAIVSGAGPHFGEERPLVGSRGSGTVFFGGCNLGCSFCQNSDISHGARGRPVEVDELAAVFAGVRAAGCHNLNLVTPTHVTPQILAALAAAVEDGFDLPLVWNSGGYDDPELLELLDGVVDIYMPDFKVWNPKVAERLLDAADYPEVAREAVAEMHRQVGDLAVDERGIARRGLLLRHLILPHELAGTAEVAAFVAGLSPATYFNLMDQYRPCFRAFESPEMARPPSARELKDARRHAEAAGLRRFD
ncbi:MAG: radical SAM protein [Polyangia bacterium]